MLELIPEFIACLVFFPLGYTFGYLVHFFLIDEFAIQLMWKIKYWPYVVASVVAIVVAGIQFAIKMKYNRYKFEHFYIILFGMIFNVAAGGVLHSKNNDPTTAIYLMAIGHGICYIPALSYINIRVTSSKFRIAKISAAHMVYLFGVAVAATIIYSDFRYLANIKINIFHRRVNQNSGLAILIISLLVGALCCLNEILHALKLYNYKSSLDEDVNRENENSTIFLKKHFDVKGDCPPTSAFQSNEVEPMVSDYKEFGFGLLAVCTRFLSLYYFYYPFFFLTILFSRSTNDSRLETANWVGFLGILLSTFVMFFISFKNQLRLTSSLTVPFLIILTGIVGISNDNNSIKIVLITLYSVMGFGQSNSNICILNIASLKSNELFLAMGYTVEHIVVGVLQYYTIYDLSLVFIPDTNFYTIFPHTVTFIGVVVCVSICSNIFPQGNFKSILSLKNVLLRKNLKPMIIAAPQYYPQNYTQQVGPDPMHPHHLVQQPDQYQMLPNYIVQQPQQYQMQPHHLVQQPKPPEQF